MVVTLRILARNVVTHSASSSVCVIYGQLPARARPLPAANELGGVDTVRNTSGRLGTPQGPTWARRVAVYPGAGPWSYGWTVWAVTPAP